MAHPDATDEELHGLTELMGEAASALVRGDIRRYAELMQHADDFTLFPPTGGEPRRGFDDSDDALEALASYFRSGAAKLQVFETYASGDLAVLVAIERQHGEIGELPEQDLSLRVTLVFRREGPAWRLVHRHADPLVHEIGEEQLGTLLRGEAGEPWAPRDVPRLSSRRGRIRDVPDAPAGGAGQPCSTELRMQGGAGEPSRGEE
ncbi:MAG TPA: nuclear transport factor 2 family protein [Gaiellaceae bacterium]